MMQCDFCGAPGRPLWFYPCPAFHIRTSWNRRHASATTDVNADWAACEPCSAAIETGLLSALRVRLLASVWSVGTTEFVIEHVWEMWVRFMQLHEPRRPFTDEDAAKAEQELAGR